MNCSSVRTHPHHHTIPHGRALTASVIISAHNAERTLTAQLDALSTQTTRDPFEVIVVDNASTDDTLGVALAYQQHLPTLRATTAPWHASAGHGRNRGAHLAHAPLLLFCDADDIVDSDWVTALTQALHTDDLVGGRVDRDHLNSAQTRAWRPGTGTGLLHGFAFLPYASAANVGIHATLFQQIGGFDEQLACGEDIDLCWRAQLAGATLGYAPDALVHYRLRTTLPATLRQLYGFGRAHPTLYRRYRHVGMPPSTHTAYNPTAAWAQICHLVPHALRSRDAFTTLCATLAFRAGRVTGSVTNRVCYL